MENFEQIEKSYVLYFSLLMFYFKFYIKQKTNFRQKAFN